MPGMLIPVVQSKNDETNSKVDDIIAFPASYQE